MSKDRDPAPMPLFDFSPAPGKTDTSAAAADVIAGRAATLRSRAYTQIMAHTEVPYYQGLTADETASLLNEDILAVRPRLTELKDMGLIEDTGRRRKNVKGNTQIVFRGIPR